MTSPRNETGQTRAIEVEVEVPGTPEEVWEAIATGPGITAWFVPTEVEEREGGALRLDFGALGADEGVVTGWEPPHRFAAKSTDGIAQEVLVEARSGGTCVVRLINSGFSSDWEDQLDGVVDGWRKHLHQLRLYLTHFAGQACASIQVMGSASGTPGEVLAALTGALAIGEPAPGGRLSASAAGAPALDGSADVVGPDAILFRTDEPAPGYGMLATTRFGDRTLTVARLYLFGHDAPEVAVREERAWQGWMDERFPFRQPAQPAETA
jgi:uncharacterized protein YndB with AHSA1/START domain